MTDITISLPHKTLAPLAASRSNQKSLELLHKEINANAISVRSTRGNGALGHRALTVSAANYTATAGGRVVFAPPLHPGDYHIHDSLTSAVEIKETNLSPTTATVYQPLH
jgi:hypothetical protein